MNATANNANTTAAASVEVLCRFDPAKNKPVVFVATNMNDAGEIQSWITGEPVMSPLSYYHSTLPLSAADETVLANSYARKFAVKHVLIRHRLPRTTRAVPNRIAKQAAPAVNAVIAPLTPPPVQQVAAPAPVVVEQAAAPVVAAKTAAKKRSTKKAAKGSRRPAAKPIEAQTSAVSGPADDRANTMRRAADNNPAPALPAAAPTLEQKVDQMAQLFNRLLESIPALQAAAVQK